MYRFIISGILLLLLPGGQTSAHSPINRADQATLLFSFIKYSEWTVFVDQSAIVIGVYGDDTVYQNLKERYSHRYLNGRKLKIKKVTGADAYDCQVLYVKDDKSDGSRMLLECVKHLQVLIVMESDSPGDAADISIWNHPPEKNDIRYRLNRRKIQAKGIKVSTDILRFAKEIVMTRSLYFGYSIPLESFTEEETIKKSYSIST